VLDIPIELIRPNPDQPRKAFPAVELDELSASIRERGVLQPILARPVAGQPNTYQIVAGERRWRAAQQAGLRAIPTLVRDLGDQEVMEVALIENIQRADLGAIEEARAYEAMARRFQRGADAIAQAVGKSRSHVANTMRLLRLPEAVRDHLEAGRLTAGHARALLDRPDAEALADRVIDQGLNVRQTEALTRNARNPDVTASPGKRGGDVKTPDTLALEADLSEVLGLKVEIRDRDGAGEVRIVYQTLEQLDALCQRLSR
jgi:ParB family chromosome partitioning protein